MSHQRTALRAEDLPQLFDPNATMAAGRGNQNPRPRGVHRSHATAELAHALYHDAPVRLTTDEARAIARFAVDTMATLSPGAPPLLVGARLATPLGRAYVDAHAKLAAAHAALTTRAEEAV